MTTLAVLVHYGDLGSTVAAAGRIAELADDLTVVANDAAARPDALDARVRWVVSTTNLGYAGGVLHALRESPPSEHVAVLNTDVDLPAGTWRRCLADLDDDPRLAVVGPVLRHPDGTLQSGAGDVRGVLRWALADRDPGPALARCEWVTGAAMFVRRAPLEAADWDPSYFLGLEDVELCRSLRTAGWDVACEGRADAVHDSGQVIGALWTYYFIRNRLWFARRHEARWRLPLIVANAVWFALRSVLGDLRHWPRRRSFALSRLFLAGLADGLRPRRRVREPRAEALLRRRAAPTP